MIELYILSIQARILYVVGIAWLAIGILCGYDPLTVAWRAALGAVVTMLVSGFLLRIGSRAILEVALREHLADMDEGKQTKEQAPDHGTGNS